MSAFVYKGQLRNEVIVSTDWYKINSSIFFYVANIIIIALQLLVGLWPHFQFLNPTQSQYDSLDGGSACLKGTTYKANNTNTE
jgi:hypothetical protein